jgi:hypothetical protein
MVFTPPAALTPKLPEISDLPLCDFTFDKRYGRHPIAKSQDPCVYGLTGKSFSVIDKRIEFIV